MRAATDTLNKQDENIVICAKKIIIFDLDGTLWRVNSHIDIIQQYYKWNDFIGFFHKVIGKCLPHVYLKYINVLFDKIPDFYVSKYCPDFRHDALNILNKAKGEGYDVFIISSAPQRILDNVVKRLDLPVLRGKPGKKSEILKRNCRNWKKLVVVTDNVSDCDLINMSDKAIAYVSPKRIRKFRKKCRRSNIEFRDWRLE